MPDDTGEQVTVSLDFEWTLPSGIPIGEVEPVMVRPTESTLNGDTLIGTLYESAAVLAFPSAAAATKFITRLNQYAEGHEYDLAPDHHDTGANFYLRCNLKR